MARRPALVRAFNVLRQYPEEQAWAAWSRLRAGLAAGGVLVEGTCDEIGRRAVWVTLPALAPAGQAAAGAALITFSARLASIERPSDLAERLPKTLIHRNVPGEPVHAVPARLRPGLGPRRAVLGLRLTAALARRGRVAVRRLAGAPLPAATAGRARWRLGEVTLPWAALAPAGTEVAGMRPGRVRAMR